MDEISKSKERHRGQKVESSKRKMVFLLKPIKKITPI